MESIPEPSPARQMDDVPQLSARTETNQPHYSPRRLTDPHHHYHPHFSPTCRPLSSHTPLGSPLHTAARLRSHSMGSLPMGAWPIDPAAPVSPLTGKFTAPLLPTLQPPPEHSETHKVMEAAVAAERTRSKKLEEEEATLTADELRAVLRRERHRTGRIAAELAALKASAVHAQLESEMIEEGRINSLMRRLDTLNQEKGRLVNELEREEEMLTNTLQKKLNEVLRDKAALERQIEKEKKAHVLLQTQLSDLRNSHLSAAAALEEEDEMEEED